MPFAQGSCAQKKIYIYITCAVDICYVRYRIYNYNISLSVVYKIYIHIQSDGHWNPIEYLWWSFFCGNSQCVKAVRFCLRRAPLRMFESILKATLFNNLL